jgi:hypothetical protein
MNKARAVLAAIAAAERVDDLPTLMAPAAEVAA